jgi:hypothetical protein
LPQYPHCSRQDRSLRSKSERLESYSSSGRLINTRNSEKPGGPNRPAMIIHHHLEQLAITRVADLAESEQADPVGRVRIETLDVQGMSVNFANRRPVSAGPTQRHAPRHERFENGPRSAERD